MLFKRGAKSDVIKAAEKETSGDEEKGGSIAATADGDHGSDIKEMKEATPEVHDTFSFHHLNYVVPVGKGETRRLLQDVSGYVPPGKLTALMASPVLVRRPCSMCSLSARLWVSLRAIGS